MVVSAPRFRGLLVVASVAASLFVGASWSRADTPPNPPTTKPPLEQLLGDLLGVTTVPPPPPPPTTPPPPPTASPGQPGPTTTTTLPLEAPRVVPPEAQRLIDSVRRTGPRDTSKLLDSLRRLEDLGFTDEEAAVMGMGRFPVAGRANYRDDWLEARFTPVFHHHQGNDIFAERGTPALAPDDGVVRYTEEAVGGKSAYVTTPDGTFYYLTHLNGYNTKVRSGSTVKMGEVVGYVGNTGNAADGAPHLHFEIHPRGGAAVNPKPYLDRWLDEAIAAVPGLLASRDFDIPRAVTAAGMLRRFEEGPVSGSSRPAEGPLLWASAVSAGGGSLTVAEKLGLRTAERIDWAGRASVQDDLADGRREAREMARHLFDPLTPSAVEAILGPVSPGSS